MDKNSPEYWYKKGIEVGNMGNHEGALECFNKAIEIEPTFIDAWFYKTLALRNLGKHEEAAECFKKVLALDKYHKLKNANNNADKEE